MLNIKRKIKQFIIKAVGAEDVTVLVSLKCPDGLCESLGYDLPKEIDAFISFMNTYSKEKDYTITLGEYKTVY